MVGALLHKHANNAVEKAKAASGVDPVLVLSLVEVDPRGSPRVVLAVGEDNVGGARGPQQGAEAGVAADAALPAAVIAVCDPVRFRHQRGPGHGRGAVLLHPREVECVRGEDGEIIIAVVVAVAALLPAAEVGLLAHELAAPLHVPNPVQFVVSGRQVAEAAARRRGRFCSVVKKIHRCARRHHQRAVVVVITSIVDCEQRASHAGGESGERGPAANVSGGERVISHGVIVERKQNAHLEQVPVAVVVGGESAGAQLKRRLQLCSALCSDRLRSHHLESAFEGGRAGGGAPSS
mmetsp:Transcript_31586/g.53346  ORF Transcript_31586/g.53346 Transcript_31586/m.53346 type:complete len:293 (-) Transcript_31586:87-965(-)